jgi:hypothetical protein
MLGQTGFDPLAGPITLDQNDEIVGVPREAVAAPLQFPVQIIEQDVGQQGTFTPSVQRGGFPSFRNRSLAQNSDWERRRLQHMRCDDPVAQHPKADHFQFDHITVLHEATKLIAAATANSA